MVSKKLSALISQVSFGGEGSQGRMFPCDGSMLLLVVAIACSLLKGSVNHLKALIAVTV